MQKIDKRTAWLIPLVLFLLLILVILFAPKEQTLGTGIRSVYVHVGLTWAGMAFLGLAALLGVGVMITDKESWAYWMRTAGWVGTLTYGAGIAMSMVASKENWGAVFLQEPRMAAALNGLAIALIVQVLISWLPQRRLGGLLALAIFVLIVWMNQAAALVLHPPNPVRTSPSVRIQLTFAAIFGLFFLLAAWAGWFWRVGSKRGMGDEG